MVEAVTSGAGGPQFDNCLIDTNFIDVQQHEKRQSIRKAIISFGIGVIAAFVTAGLPVLLAYLLR